MFDVDDMLFQVVQKFLLEISAQKLVQVWLLGVPQGSTDVVSKALLEGVHSLPCTQEKEKGSTKTGAETKKRHTQRERRACTHVHAQFQKYMHAGKHFVHHPSSVVYITSFFLLSASHHTIVYKKHTRIISASTYHKAHAPHQHTFTEEGTRTSRCSTSER